MHKSTFTRWFLAWFLAAILLLCVSLGIRVAAAAATAGNACAIYTHLVRNSAVSALGWSRSGAGCCLRYRSKNAIP